MPKRVRPRAITPEPVEAPSIEPVAEPLSSPADPYHEAHVQIDRVSATLDELHKSLDRITLTINAYGNGSGTWSDIVLAHTHHVEIFTTAISRFQYLENLIKGLSQRGPP